MPFDSKSPLRFKMAVLLALMVVAWVGTTSKVCAADMATVGSVTIEHPWARPTDAMAKTSAVYFVLKNKGAETDRLVSVSTPIAETAQIHTNTMRDGMLHMEPVAGIDIPANGSAELKPGGFHVMLMGPRQQLKPGQHFEMTLTFAKAGQITIQVPVERGGTADKTMDHGNMGHMEMKDDMGGMKH